MNFGQYSSKEPAYPEQLCGAVLGGVVGEVGGVQLAGGVPPQQEHAGLDHWTAGWQVPSVQ